MDEIVLAAIPSIPFVSLHRVRDDGDGRDGLFMTAAAPKIIVTIVTTVTPP